LTTKKRKRNNEEVEKSAKRVIELRKNETRIYKELSSINCLQESFMYKLCGRLTLNKI